MKKYLLFPLFSPILSILLCSLSINFIYIFVPYAIPAIAQEKGMIEILTYTNYGLMFIAFALFYRDFKTNLINYFVFIFLGISALLREMGIQHWLTSHDTTAFKIKFFTNPNNPISEKILAVFILSIFLCAIIYIVKKYTIYLVKTFFRMDTISWTVGTLIAFLLTGKIVDRIPGNYRNHNGKAMLESIRNNLMVLEEVSEMLLPIIVIVGLIQYHYIKQENK